MHRLIIITGLSLFTSAQACDPPLDPSPPPAPTGVGCIGNSIAVFFAADGSLGITWQEFQDDYAVDTDGDGRPNYLPWIQGSFDPLSPVTPCDMMPGGD